MSTDPDVAKLRERFASFQCHGVVALIDYLASPEAEGMTYIGSSTIGLSEILNEIWVSKEAQLASAWFRTRSLHIGSNDGSVTPLQWMEKLSEVFEHVSVPARTRFDQLCRAFAHVAQLKPAGDVEIANRNGYFRVPPNAWHRDMTDEELEPYRVEKLNVFGDDDTPQVRYDTPFDEPTKH